MRPSLPLLAVVAVAAALATGPAPAVRAEHDCAHDGPPADARVAQPCPANEVGTAGSERGWHEEMPDWALLPITPDKCALSGAWAPGVTPFAGPQHDAVGATNVDPAHNHFSLVGGVVTCAQSGPYAILADGGVDGHSTEGTLEADRSGPDGEFQHAAVDHHGTVAESGWSHSSRYSGGAGGGESNGPDMGACGSSGGKNNNKADVTVDHIGGTPNWLKYVRLGSVVDLWGCSEGFAPNRRFEFRATIARDPFLPGNLVVVGAGWIGPRWVVNNRP